MKELSSAADEAGAVKNEQISELKAQLKYYEEDLGRQQPIPAVKKLNYMLDHDFPVDQIMQRPPNEAQVFIETEHRKNLGLWSIQFVVTA